MFITSILLINSHLNSFIEGANLYKCHYHQFPLVITHPINRALIYLINYSFILISQFILSVIYLFINIKFTLIYHYFLVIDFFKFNSNQQCINYNYFEFSSLIVKIMILQENFRCVF